MRPRAALPPSVRTMERRSREVVAAKLNRFASVSGQGGAAINALCWNTRRLAAVRDIVGEGSRPVGVRVILEGMGMPLQVAA